MNLQKVTAEVHWDGQMGMPHSQEQMWSGEEIQLESNQTAQVVAALCRGSADFDADVRSVRALLNTTSEKYDAYRHADEKLNLEEEVADSIGNLGGLFQRLKESILADAD
ncbi:hypothetical protein XU18_3045 [Perkinsela sp. CCAP 1560/4]|nr:hypothetical protein XU18_3045 [Perkinsela sp. CCAP 1560/4]|eukprot:KNH06108.1 hypothetical protein XU18_3045 [Perkinsela sp. CCAP 1560/4]